MTHQFRQRLRNGDLLIGPMVTLSAPEVAELMAGVGYDWLFLDAEHGTFAASQIQAVLQSAGAQMPCVVRVPIAEEVPIKKALDVGAAGVIAPQVNTAEQAERVVRFSKYWPDGTRGLGISRAAGYGLRLKQYVESANDQVAVIVQAEHADAVDNIESIVAVPGIDAVLIGPYDLSASYGKPGQVNDPEIVDAIGRVTKACLEAGVRLGMFGVSADAVRPYLDKGFTLIIAGVDTLMLGHAAGNMLAELRP